MEMSALYGIASLLALCFYIHALVMVVLAVLLKLPSVGVVFNIMAGTSILVFAGILILQGHLKSLSVGDSILLVILSLSSAFAHAVLADVLSDWSTN
jgi:hypothetical protein